MSGEDNFIARWSRLKRQAAESKGARADVVDAPGGETRDAGVEQGAKAAGSPHPEAEPTFDPASLPPIDSIVADSDIRAFLQKGVPPALTRAALRRAWTTDPAIRDFIEIAENQWDFTDPASIPGFGTLDSTVDLHKLVAQATGNLPDAPDLPALSEGSPTAESSEGAGEAVEPPARDDEPTISDDPSPVDVAASQHEDPAPGIGPTPSRKAHGRALPR